MSYSCNGKMAAALQEYTNHVLRGSMVVALARLTTGLLLVHEPTDLRASVLADGSGASRSPRAGGLKGRILTYLVCLPFATLRCGAAEWNWVGGMHRCDGYVGV